MPNTKIKDIVFCILYFLAMILIMTYGYCMPGGAFYLLLSFAPSHEKSMLYSLDMMIFISLIILFIMSVILYYIAPLLLTFIVVKKKWSKLINSFFDNLFLMTTLFAAIIIFSIIMDKTDNTFTFYFCQRYKEYIVPECATIYTFFFIRKLYLAFLNLKKRL